MTRWRRLLWIFPFALLITALFCCHRVPVEMWREGSDRSVTVRRLTSLSARPSEMRFAWIEPLRMWAGETEVTMEQLHAYDRFCTEYSYYERAPGFSWDWPAMNVTDRSAEGFARWLNKQFSNRLPVGYEFRLPTTTEWETIARCGTDRKYPWGNEWPPVSMADGHFPNLMGEDKSVATTESEQEEWAALVGDEFLGIPRHPGEFIPRYRDGFPGPCPVLLSGHNEWGLYAMAGNVQEWCWDPKANDNVLKGGDFISWTSGQNEITFVREIRRGPSPFAPWIEDRHSTEEGGFRVVVAKKWSQLDEAENQAVPSEKSVQP